jgi:TonB-dependent SusC/RagA subfamily outer membrane receptor
VPGLQVIGSGESYTLRVRGIQSFQGNAEPLVVIDGMSIRTGGVSSTLNTIRPSDIVKVDVLKDAGSTAFYGQAGVNGVIVITTRKANP